MSAYIHTPVLFDRAKTLSISQLKEFGYLAAGNKNRGILKWEKEGQQEATVNINADMLCANPSLTINYWLNDKEVTTRIALATFPSNLGKGKVWKFICPYTGLACFKLYECNGILIHRSAIRGLYFSQTYNKTSRHILQDMAATMKITEKTATLKKKYAKPFYNGKPTKRNLAMQKIIQKLEAPPSSLTI